MNKKILLWLLSALLLVGLLAFYRLNSFGSKTSDQQLNDIELNISGETNNFTEEDVPEFIN